MLLEDSLRYRWLDVICPQEGAASSLFVRHSLRSAEEGFVQGIPVVGGGDAGFEFSDEGTAAVGVGHDGDAISFANVAEHVANESPFPAAVAEIPAFAAFFDVQADRVWPYANGGDHGVVIP